MIRRKLGPDGALPVFLFDIGGTANELITSLVKDKQGRAAADIGDRAIDDGVILQIRYLRDLNAADGAILQRDLGILEGLGKGQRECAQIGIDIAASSFGEFRR